MSQELKLQLDAVHAKVSNDILHLPPINHAMCMNLNETVAGTLTRGDWMLILRVLERADED